MMYKSRTTTQAKWHSTIAEFASNSDYMIRHYGGYCDDPLSFHLHHVIGARAKRKVNFVSTHVGEFVVIPVPVELHDVSSNNRLNVTHQKKHFERVFGSQLSLWLDMINQMRILGYNIPFGQEIITGVLGS